MLNDEAKRSESLNVVIVTNGTDDTGSSQKRVAREWRRLDTYCQEKTYQEVVKVSKEER